MLAHLPAPNEKCLVLKGQACSQVADLPFLSPVLSCLQRDTEHFGECFMCRNTCAVASDTTDLGVGWEAVFFLSSFSRTRRKLKGRGREGVARLRGGGHAIYRQDKESIAPSSSQVTLQPL